MSKTIVAAVALSVLSLAACKTQTPVQPLIPQVETGAMMDADANDNEDMMEEETDVIQGAGAQTGTVLKLDVETGTGA